MKSIIGQISSIIVAMLLCMVAVGQYHHHECTGEISMAYSCCDADDAHHGHNCDGSCALTFCNAIIVDDDSSVDSGKLIVADLQLSAVNVASGLPDICCKNAVGHYCPPLDCCFMQPLVSEATTPRGSPIAC